MNTAPSNSKAPEDRRTKYTLSEWNEEASKRFGKDSSAWKFVCPSCGHVASTADWKAAGAPEGAVAFSCVGRWLKHRQDAFGTIGGPCNYAGGGLFHLNPITVVAEDGKEHTVFDFAGV